LLETLKFGVEFYKRFDGSWYTIVICFCHERCSKRVVLCELLDLLGVQYFAFTFVGKFYVGAFNINKRLEFSGRFFSRGFTCSLIKFLLFHFKLACLQLFERIAAKNHFLSSCKFLDKVQILFKEVRRGIQVNFIAGWNPEFQGSAYIRNGWAQSNYSSFIIYCKFSQISLTYFDPSYGLL